MATRTVEQVDDWDTVPFSGGYGGLRDLADDEFSGVVTSGPSRLFMLSGNVVGVLDGDIEDFDGADGVAKQAPHRALPLLAVMQERSDEVRAKYYTEDTALSEVDRTLSDGGFTGFVELSENVLSGDYYQVYHQGRSMSVAWVGSAERLITDDDAFEQANDEVGIFKVRPVDIEVIDIPEPEDDGDEAATTDVDAAPDADPTTGTDGRDESADSGSGSAGGTATAPDRTSSDERTADADSTGSAPAGAKTAGAGDPSTSVDDDPAPTEPTGAPDAEASAGTADADRADAPREARDGSGGSAGPDQPRNAGERTGAVDETTSDARQSGTDAADAGRETTDAAREPAETAARESRGDARPSGEQRPETDRRDERSRDETRRSGNRRDASARSDADAGGRSADRSGRQEPSAPDRGPTPTAPEREPNRSESSGAAAGRSGTGSQRASDAGPGGERSGPVGGSAGSAADLEVRSIPSLDPAHTEAASAAATASAETTSRDRGGRGTRTETQSASPDATGTEQRDEPDRSPSAANGGQPARREQSPEPAAESASERTAEAAEDDVQEDLAAARDRVDDLQEELSRVESERDQLREERDDLQAERDELAAELEEARAEIERLEQQVEDLAGESATAGAETRLGAAEAVDQTNLFVRYDSKGEATLESAHAGDADRSTVDSNLRLEYHTQFDADSAAVGEQSFDDFLTDTIQYRFVDWLVRNLLYEVRDTGHADSMSDLYDALPRIDRAELNGQVSVEFTEEGETQRTQERFDVVVRDRMGNPLIVANINDSRDPATDSMMTDLVRRGERVGESSDSLAGAFLVTESFFEPAALETAEEATSSGLFSRDKRKSFVNLSRKSGYHLCLVEARNREFHLAVPEL